MTVYQHFKRFAIPFSAPLLFSPWMAQITTAETSSREEKWCPRMGCFNLWNKWKSGGLMSGPYGAWGNNSHSYLLSKSVTTFPRCGCALLCKMSGPSSRKSGRFLCILCAIFAASHDNMLLLHLFDLELCHDDSSMIISKDHNLLDLWFMVTQLSWKWVDQ
jgi:hypothetical protein